MLPKIDFCFLKLSEHITISFLRLSVKRRRSVTEIKWAQPTGDTIPQSTPLYISKSGKNAMVQNNMGGYVFKLNDSKRLLRFIIMGSEGGSYYVKEKELQRENVTCIDRLIGAGAGSAGRPANQRNQCQQTQCEAERFIACIRNLCQNVTTRTQRKLRTPLLSEICRIPTHLFMFIKVLRTREQRGGRRIWHWMGPSTQAGCQQMHIHHNTQLHIGDTTATVTAMYTTTSSRQQPPPSSLNDDSVREIPYLREMTNQKLSSASTKSATVEDSIPVQGYNPTPYPELMPNETKRQPFKAKEVPTEDSRPKDAIFDWTVRNNENAFVFPLKDMQRLLRFLVLGYSGGTYYATESDVQRENIDFIKQLINDGKGVDVITKVTEVNFDRRNLRQDSLLIVLAICARCNDESTKTAAYMHLSKICRTPTHLFQFVEFCEQESRSGTGWGKAHKRAVSEWYTGFAPNPELLARVVTKCKRRNNWSHIDVIRLSHTKTSDPAVGFILRYITKGLDKAREMYINGKRITSPEVLAKLNKLAELIKGIEEAATCINVDQLCHIIRLNKLSWEHCNSDLLKYKDVWLALLPHMSVEATLRNLGRMTSYGMFAENSEEEQLVLDKILRINTTPLLQLRDEDMFMNEDDELFHFIQILQSGIRRNIVHPFSILPPLLQYNAGHGDRSNLSWTPNRRIVQALDDAFHKAFQTIQSSGKKFYLAVDVSDSMSQPVLGSSNIHCLTAAAVMMMVTARTEDHCIIKGFSDGMVDIPIESTHSLDIVQRSLDGIPAGETDCSLPMIDAMDKKIKDIDVFVIYTDNETGVGKCHPFYALQDYRKYSGKHDVKLIVCGMSATSFSIADQNDPYMLDVVGFDSAVPSIISRFAIGEL
ncbi:RNA-binding protein RO60-like [Ruditapes philippinarum]|uniref:RNA-binding protein RO60-like n=1 Tax=Ruditapes philippinarum TaxID=129788 RepID=UPI00295A75FB|nr:RNA-binding protein RO60-like [Ruditapes philippinarum]